MNMMFDLIFPVMFLLIFWMILYYVTFEVESGDRMEFSVYGKEYGMLAEGDEGKLTFQGSRYLGFERAIEN